MEACVLVEREQDKITKKLRLLSGSSANKLQGLIDQVARVKERFQQGQLFVLILNEAHSPSFPLSLSLSGFLPFPFPSFCPPSITLVLSVSPFSPPPPLPFSSSLPLHPLSILPSLASNSDSGQPVTATEKAKWVKELHKTTKEECQSISSEHKDIHASISKYGRAIDKVCDL